MKGRIQIDLVSNPRFLICIFPLLVFTLAVLPACSKTRSELPAPLTVEMLKNAEYHSEWTESGVARLTDGEFRERILPNSASELIIAFYPDMYSVGDLNGDLAEDAAVILATSGGGSGTFISLEAVVNDQGTPHHVATANLGDRTRVKSLFIESGIITVDMVTHGPSDPMCCPTLETTNHYKLEGDTLIQVPGIE